MFQASQGICQSLALFFLAPLLLGSIKKQKAFWQNRQGPGLLQPYRDFHKFLRKEPVVAQPTSWISRIAPYGVLLLTIAAFWFIPLGKWPAATAGWADWLVLLYLLAALRLLLVLAGLDSASAFGGEGSSRELFISTLVEPALFLILLTVSLSAGSQDLGQISNFMRQQGLAAFSPAYFLGLLSLLIVTIAETGRIPVDNPDTHLELTMVHEGMLLEFGGKYLGMLHWAAAAKEVLILSLVIALYLPWTPAWAGPAGWLADLFFFLLKLFALGSLLAVIETALAKLRIFRVPDLLGAAFLLALLANLSHYVIGG